MAVIALNRMGFGPRPGDLEAFNGLGEDDDTRLERYVDQQLNPAFIDDGLLEIRWINSGFTTLKKSVVESWMEHFTNNQGYNHRIQPFREMERAVFTRALYSKRQLIEVLAGFWHDHFNIYGLDYLAAPLWAHYDRDIIRGNMLGNFRVMLESVATSLPMLYYLDNHTNTASGPNENFARELFELHGLGAENYFGVARQDSVPRDEDGVPIGYVDDDVYEATRCLTGWTIDYSTGFFRYAPADHDRFQKRVLGKFIPADQPPLKDGRDVLDAIASHPGTARYIARKLCRRFIADDPPQSVVLEAARVFMEHRDSADQLERVVRTILLSAEFKSTWGHKVKRPFELIVSSMRAADVDFDLKLDDRVSNWFMDAFSKTGHAPFRWGPPDGYPDRAEAWLGSNSLVMCWKLINWLNEVKNWWNGTFQPFDPVAAMPAGTRTPGAVTDFWIQRILGRPISAEAREELVLFLASGRNPEMELLFDTDEIAAERLWALVALLMMSPENLQK